MEGRKSWTSNIGVYKYVWVCVCTFYSQCKSDVKLKARAEVCGWKKLQASVPLRETERKRERETERGGGANMIKSETNDKK